MSERCSDSSNMAAKDSIAWDMGNFLRQPDADDLCLKGAYHSRGGLG